MTTSDSLSNLIHLCVQVGDVSQSNLTGPIELQRHPLASFEAVGKAEVESLSRESCCENDTRICVCSAPVPEHPSCRVEVSAIETFGGCSRIDFEKESRNDSLRHPFGPTPSSQVVNEVAIRTRIRMQEQDVPIVPPTCYVDVDSRLIDDSISEQRVDRLANVRIDVAVCLVRSANSDEVQETLDFPRSVLADAADFRVRVSENPIVRESLYVESPSAVSLEHEQQVVNDCTSNEHITVARAYINEVRARPTS